MLKHIIRPLLIGVLVGAVATLAVLLLMSFLASSIDIPIAAVLPLATVANAIGSFLCGFSCAKTSGRNGWLLGLLSSFLLFLITTVAGLNLYETVDGSFLMIKALIMLACGMVGGIFAVNSGKQHRRK